MSAIPMITPLQIIFYAFAALAVVAALTVITARNPVTSALALVVTFFAMAGVWMLLHAEFLSLILLLVYVGAVMTLFLFVVMMLSINREERLGSFVNYLPFGLILFVVFIGLLFYSFGRDYLPMTGQAIADNANNLQELGMLLFSEYVYPFEIAGILLLTAIVAAITLGGRGIRKRKFQDPAAQVQVRPEDCVRLVSMPAVQKMHHEGKP